MDVILPILLSLSVLFGYFDYTKTDEFRKIIENVERWRPLIEEVKANDGRDDIPTDLALAVIAQESKGHPRIISGDKYKSVGLMQVIPRDWVGTTEQLKNPRFNIEWGLWFLEKGLEYCEGDEHCALRVFNCGPDNALGSFCGVYYANRVTKFWRPYFRNVNYSRFHRGRLDRNPNSQHSYQIAFPASALEEAECPNFYP